MSTIEEIREHLVKRKAEIRPFPSTELYIAHVEYLLSLLDASPTEAGLDCAMCNAPNAFVISPLDPAVGYCFKEQTAWRIYPLTCATEGCSRPKATFGDHCMSCLEDRVNAAEGAQP